MNLAQRFHTDTDDSRLADILAEADRIEQQIARSCGMSDVLYTTRLHLEFNRLIDTVSAPQSRDRIVETLSKKYDFDPAPELPEIEYDADTCPSTGLDMMCCPCGCSERDD